MSDPAPLNYMSIFIGEFEVVERKDAIGAVAINLGNNVHIILHIVGLPMTIKPGDKLPLFTKIPYNPEPINNALLGKPEAS